MRAFDYNSFADLAQVFDLRKGQIVPSQPMMQTEPMARVTLYSTTSLKAQLAQSKFVSLGALLPTITPRFLTASAKAIKPVVIEIAPVIAAPVTPAFAVAAPATPTAPAVTAEAPKVRTTLRLKTKVELPALQPLTRRSTVEDLAAAFRTEKALMEKKAVAGPAMTLEDAFAKRRRHPLSDKPWSELLAEVEAPKQSKSNFDLAQAFKAEMKAFMAEQARIGGEISVGEAPATLQFKSAAQQNNISQQPQRRMHMAA